MSKLLLCVVLLAGLVCPSYGGVIFSNLGPGDSYETRGGSVLGLSGFDVTTANAFTPGVTSRLSSMEVAISLIRGANELDLWLAADSGGQPGAVIESFHASGAMGTFGYPNPLIVFSSALHPVLIAGEQYWIYAHVAAPAYAGWLFNITGDMGPRGDHTAGHPWLIPGVPIGRDAFRVNGEAIPEPATFFLLGLGLVLAGLRRVVK